MTHDAGYLSGHDKGTAAFSGVIITVSQADMSQEVFANSSSSICSDTGHKEQALENIKKAE